MLLFTNFQNIVYIRTERKNFANKTQLTSNNHKEIFQVFKFTDLLKFMLEFLTLLK